MGASEWYYFVPYQADVVQALTELQGRVLADGAYDRGVADRRVVGSMEELWAAQQTEEFWDEGTHSILDMHRVNDSAQPDDVGAIRALSAAEARALLGSETPGRSDLERHRGADSYLDFPRWSGRYTVLYQDGKPHELAFWGYSGD